MKNAFITLILFNCFSFSAIAGQRLPIKTCYKYVETSGYLEILEITKTGYKIVIHTSLAPFLKTASFEEVERVIKEGKAVKKSCKSLEK